MLSKYVVYEETTSTRFWFLGWEALKHGENTNPNKCSVRENFNAQNALTRTKAIHSKLDQILFVGVRPRSLVRYM